METITGFHHVGMVADDPVALAEFYRDVLGMTITGGSSADGPFGVTAFLSSRPEEEDHELALFANPMYRHFAFKVASLADLRTLSRQITERGIPIKMTMNHGCSLAFYIDDPEGNMIEIYWPTGLHNSQPYGPVRPGRRGGRAHPGGGRHRDPCRAGATTRPGGEGDYPVSSARPPRSPRMVRRSPLRIMATYPQTAPGDAAQC